MHQKNKNIPLGSFYIILASTAYTFMGACVKFGKDIPDQQLVFMRNFICLLLMLPWVLFPKPKPLKTEVFITHLVRASAGLLNMYCFFFSIRYILLTDAMLLNNTMPLFLPFVVWIWQGEKLPLKLLPGLILGFIGVIFILHPGPTLFHPAALMALASGIFMSISMAGIRELGKIEPIYKILFYYFAISSFVSALPLFWSWKNQTLFLWLILLGVGICAALYQYFLTKGYQYASASKISPLIYFAVILSALFDWLFWNNAPTIMSYIGVLAVIIGSIWTIQVEG